MLMSIFRCILWLASSSSERGAGELSKSARTDRGVAKKPVQAAMSRTVTMSAAWPDETVLKDQHDLRRRQLPGRGDREWEHQVLDLRIGCFLDFVEVEIDVVMETQVVSHFMCHGEAGHEAAHRDDATAHGFVSV